MHPLFRSFTKEKQMHLSESKAPDETDTLKAVYRRLEAIEKKNG